MPFALEKIDLSQYDLIISSESGPAKGVITNPDSIHICYCHSPMRYIWDMHATYLTRAGKITKFIFPVFAHWLRLWDRVSADRVDFFIANSSFVKKRIKKFYRRESELIYPPVDVSGFSPLQKRDEYYLWLGQLTAYKRPDLMISAFNALGLPLVVIGDGEEYSRLVTVANQNIKFLRYQPNVVVKDYLERCRAVIFPGVEDFGIVPVEAMAAGAPVIAYGRGGVVDTVTDGVTGLLFKEQTQECLMEAVLRIESGKDRFDPSVLHVHAMKFDTTSFKKNFLNFVTRCQS
jgi:glycosyltransferase involved in cell wall biosynthesis